MSDTEDLFIKQNPLKLWPKRDYYYKLTDDSRQKIIQEFENKILNNSTNNNFNALNNNNNFNALNNNNNNFNINNSQRNIDTQNIKNKFPLNIRLNTFDAFYSSTHLVPINDIDLLKSDQYIKTRLESKKLREYNLQLIDYNKNLLLQIENNIKLYRSCTNKKTQLIYYSIIKKLQKISLCVDSVRNWVSEICIQCEECSRYVEMCSICVNKR